MLIGSAQDASKPTCLKENKIPKFRHVLILSAKKKAATEWVMAFQFSGTRFR
jgi:hypothetical protein